MFSLQEFIDRCQTNDPRAWEELCAIVETAARYRIRKLLTSNRFDQTQDDDVLQELYRQMRVRCCRRLSVFRGTTYAELRAFMGMVAYRFAKKLIAQWCRKRKKEEQAMRRAGLPARDGPTDEQIAKVHRDLLSAMAPADQQKLYHLSQEAVGPTPESPGSVPERDSPRIKWRIGLVGLLGRRAFWRGRLKLRTE